MGERPMFEGQEVISVEGKATGTVGDRRLNDVLAPGDRVVLVCTASVGRIEHYPADGEGTVTRRQHFKIADGFIVSDETDADDLIHKLRSDRQRELDELLGTPPLFDGDEPDGDA